MNPEDVPAELVEKAYRARTAAQHGRPLDDAVWSAIRSRIEEAWIASALAAVMPDIQAQAFEAAAVRVRADFAAHGEQCPWVGFLDDEAARLRAARLTDTSEGEEK